jgi:hypothetical protein
MTHIRVRAQSEVSPAGIGSSHSQLRQRHRQLNTFNPDTPLTVFPPPVQVQGDISWQQQVPLRDRLRQVWSSAVGQYAFLRRASSGNGSVSHIAHAHEPVVSAPHQLKVPAQLTQSERLNLLQLILEAESGRGSTGQVDQCILILATKLYRRKVAWRNRNPNPCITPALAE